MVKEPALTNLGVEIPTERKKNNVTHLKLISGGGDNTSGNWLLDLPVGTQFFVSDKLERQNFLLLKLEVLKTDMFAVTLWAYPTDMEDLDGKPFGTVHPQRFTNRFDLVKVIAYPQKQEEENTDG